MSIYEIVERGTDYNDSTCSNRWLWSWCEKKVCVNIKEKVPKTTWNGPDVVTFTLGQHIRKISSPGMTICVLCKNKPISYDDRGVSNITDHLKVKRHVENYVIERMNQSLPNTSHEVRHPYGVNPEIVNNVCAEPAVHAPKVCLTDRILNQEALLISYCAERNLPFSCAGEILDISKELCRDRNALQRTQLHRTTASYKLQYGASTTIGSHLNSILKDTFFSLNTIWIVF